MFWVTTKVTLFEEGELSEPEEVVMDSSSADMDFPVNLWWRKKYWRFNIIYLNVLIMNIAL